MCEICWWEDDGQDDADADDVRGGPNAHYSLSDARRNFRDHGHMYDKNDAGVLLGWPSRARRNLLGYVMRVRRDGLEIDHAELQRLTEACRGSGAYSWPARLVIFYRRCFYRHRRRRAA